LTSHFYISRPIFLHRASFEDWPDDLQKAMQDAVTEAVAFQRELAVEENTQSIEAIEKVGCEFVKLTPAEHAAFVAAVQPLRDEAKKVYGEAMFKMLPKA
jgi:C4-dicarboxylate-binding protein DctP